MPAVGMNIASCIKGTRSIDEVAAFPGKITIVGGKLRHHETPSFGASNHLASILIQAHTMNDAKTAVINLKPTMKDGKADLGKIKQTCEELVTHLRSASKGKLPVAIVD